MLKNKLAFVIAGLIVGSLGVGSGIGYWYAHQNDEKQTVSDQATAKVLYWYDPMKPEQDRKSVV